MDLPSQDWDAHLAALLARVGLGDGGRLLVALSGGPDSLCLAHLLWTRREPLRLELSAAHMDHGIRPSSADEANAVQRICREWGVPCYTRRHDVPTLASREGGSLEVAARRARYGYLAEVARQHGCRVIALAHHADDQVETVLWRLIRGAGTGGLRGIRPVAPLDPDLDPGAARGHGPLTLLRPLLPVTRDQIETYCRLYGLAPVTDASNADETIPRNWLRHTVVPMLRSRAPHLAASIGRTAEVLSAEDELLQSLTEQAWQSCDKELVEGAVRLGLASLQSQHPALLRRMLRRAYALVAGSLRDLGWQHVHDLERLIDEGGVGATVSLPGALQAALGYHWLTIGRGDGFAPRWRPRMAAGEVAEVAWPGRWRSPRADWRLTMRLMARDELPEGWSDGRHRYLAYLDADRLPTTLLLRTRSPGDRLRPLGMVGSQSLQDLFVDRRVPRAERDQVPLVVAGERILWVVGCRQASDAAVTSETVRVLELRIAADEEADV